LNQWHACILAGLVFGGAACQKTVPSQPPAPDKAVATQVLQNFELNDVQKGVRTMMLQSTEARIFEKEQVADVDFPHVTFFKEAQISSQLWSQAGKIFLQTHEIEAWGSVRVVTADSATLTTERLRYDPQKQKIFSNEPVRLEKPDSVTEGQSFESDPSLKDIKISRQKVTMKKGVRQ